MSVMVGLIVKAFTDITFIQRVWPVVNLELNQILWAWHLMDSLFMAQLMITDNSSHRKFHKCSISVSVYILFISSIHPFGSWFNLLGVKLSHLNVRDTFAGWKQLNDVHGLRTYKVLTIIRFNVRYFVLISSLTVTLPAVFWMMFSENLVFDTLTSMFYLSFTFVKNTGSRKTWFSAFENLNTCVLFPSNDLLRNYYIT